MFSRLYVSFFQHEIQAWPPALSDRRRLRLGTKSDLLTCLEDLCLRQIKSADATCVVLDGATIIQMTKPAAANTFDEYAQEVSHIFLLSCTVCLVWTSFATLTRMTT